MKVQKKIRIFFYIAVIVKTLGLFYKIILTRLIGLEGMTLYSLVFPILSLSLCLSSLSIQIVINQKVSINNIYKSRKTKDIVGACLRITITSSSIISLIVLFSYSVLNRLYETEGLYYPLIISIPLIYFANFSGILKGYFEANKNFHITSLSNLFEQIAKIVISLLFLYLFRDYDIIMQVSMSYLGISLSEIVSFTYLIYKIKKMTSFEVNMKKNKGLEREILSQSIPLTLMSLVASLTSFLEPIIFVYASKKIGLSSIEAERYYGMISSYAIPILIMAIFSSISIAKTTFPFICESVDDKKKVIFYIRRGLFFCLIFASLNINISYFYSDIILKLFYNDTSSSYIVHFLSFFYFFTYFTPLFSVVLQAIGQEKKLLYTQILSQIFTLSLIYILCSNRSTNKMGYAIALGLNGALIMFIEGALVYKRYHFLPPLNSLITLFLIVAFNFLSTIFMMKYHSRIFCFITCNLIMLIFFFFYYISYLECRKNLFHLKKRNKCLKEPNVFQKSF